ncbi:MAG: hypothetical protein PHY11_00730 [Bacilli bacterium]|nr:hypothetical protein [Bacilli bacterium]
MKYLRGCKIEQIGIANDFYEAYKRCFTGDESEKIIAIPGFTNGFFACELYLKILTDNKINDHDLFKLYLGINERQKRSLLEQYSKVQQDGLPFEDFLQKVNNGFIFWRYIYEEINKSFEDKYPFLYSNIFLSLFLPILKQMAGDYLEDLKRE